MKRALNILLNSVLAVFMLAFLVMIIVPHVTGLKFEPVLSGSMEPEIRTGALIVISRTDPESIEEGDIISFWVKGSDLPVCHRVVERVQTGGGYGFITKGDANEEADDWIVGPYDVIGKLAGNLAGLGYATRFVKSPSGFICLLVVPASIIAFLEARKLLVASRARRKRPSLMGQNKKRMNALVPLFDGLLAVCILWGIMAVSVSDRSLGSLALIVPDGNNQEYIAKRTVRNKGRVPMVICLASTDQTVKFTEQCLRIYPGEEKMVDISGPSPASRIKMAGYFPILPQATLYRLFSWNALLAPLVVSAVWIGPLTVTAFVVMRLFFENAEPMQRIRNLKGIQTGE